MHFLCRRHLPNHVEAFFETTRPTVTGWRAECVNRVKEASVRCGVDLTTSVVKIAMTLHRDSKASKSLQESHPFASRERGVSIIHGSSDESGLSRFLVSKDTQPCLDILHSCLSKTPSPSVFVCCSIIRPAHSGE